MIGRFEHSPWDFWAEADDTAQAAQRAIQQQLIATLPDATLGTDCFVSELASVHTEVLRMGDRSYIAAGAYLTGDIRVGNDVSMNPYTVVRGRVVLGDGVRIGAHTSILGFTHTMADPDLPVFRQPLASRGITIGHDVWIGSHVVILDGVDVGDHTVLAAGAIVTKNVEAGAIVASNPARVLRWRIPPAGGASVAAHDLAECVAQFGDRARAAVGDILNRSWDADRELFLDRPGTPPTVRAQCDTIEIADLLLGTAPPQLPAVAQIERLRGWQDAATGEVPELGQPNSVTGDPDVDYHVLSVGYALDLLGAQFAEPLRLVTELTPDALTTFVDALPWADGAWHAGHWVDILGTALHWSARRGDDIPIGTREALFGWLITHVDPATGMWGRPTADEGLLQIVNGFYRASRGTFAQSGLPVPYPEAVIDTVLRHARDRRFFEPAAQNACNVLDVAHPLWLTRHTGYRAEEVGAVARTLLDDALSHWTAGAGFGFHAPSAGSPASEPGLQGTEMWLATVWYLAELAGVGDALGYRPRGVHRPEPATQVTP
ncbi:MAG: acyltransferase [Pseudolysinimonas sp.]|uniref:acyltransferase n=1 Tax=Pseudolysinimonas sp. TaxID=2680009 RepID=UPI003264EDC3